MSELSLPEDCTVLTRKAWKVLEDERESLGLPDLKIQTVPEFLGEAEKARMSREDKEAILDQAALMLENFYAHLPYKKQRFADADPIGKLSLIRDQLDTFTDLIFHSMVQFAFAGVHDSHTTYTPPPPYQGAIAFLPFQIRFYLDDNGKRRFIVTRVMRTSKGKDFEHKFFQPGAEIVGNGVQPIEEVMQISAQLQPGANPAAFASRGAGNLTLRPLASVSFAFGPEDKPNPSAAFEYIPQSGGKTRLISFPWGVGTGFEAGGGIPGSVFSLNQSLSTCRTCEKILWDRDRMHREKRGTKHVAMYPTNMPALRASEKNSERATSAPDPEQVSKFPATFEFQITGGVPQAGGVNPLDLGDADSPDKKFGYLRIRNFGANQAGFVQDDLLDEFRRILTILDHKAPDGLILDIRSNPGGLIPAAEKMLQMLTPKRISPALFHYANRPAVLRILKIFRSRKGDAKGPPLAGDVSEFKAWINDTRKSVSPDGHLISGRPLTVPAEANDTGQVYQGPVVLLIDALTYSAADIFAGGFMDHEIGKMIGVDISTGGGGANVWDHGELLKKIPKLRNLQLKSLPGGANMHLAIRRSTRVGPNAGVPIEDIGVVPPIVHLRTLDDLLFNSRDLLQRACRELSGFPICRIKVDRVQLKQGAVEVTIRSENVKKLIFYLDGKRRLVMDAVSGSARSIKVPVGVGVRSPSVLRIEGKGRVEPPLSERHPAVSTSVTLQPAQQMEKRSLAFIRQPRISRRRS